MYLVGNKLDFLRISKLVLQPLARIWEFLLGAIYMLNESKLKNYKKFNFRYFGIFFIFISMYLYQDDFINNLLPKFLLFLGTILFLLDDNEKSAIINSSLLILWQHILLPLPIPPTFNCNI